MAKKKHQRVFEGDSNQGLKAHPDNPSRGRPPTGDTAGQQRGEAGQFTDKGSPGFQKK